MDNPLGVTGYIAKRNKKLQAIFLDMLEDTLIDQPEKYVEIRKAYLDSMNELNRLWIKHILGEIENIAYR